MINWKERQDENRHTKAVPVVARTETKLRAISNAWRTSNATFHSVRAHTANRAPIEHSLKLLFMLPDVQGIVPKTSF